MTDYDSETSDTERPSECDSCGQTLFSFSDEQLDDGCCPYCLGTITERRAKRGRSGGATTDE